MKENLQQALNDQINHELYAAYLYLSMAEHFQANNLDGFAHWMRQQREEETGHAMKIFDFVLDRDGRVKLQTIEAPKGGYKSTLEIAKQALAHEQKVTQEINEIYELAKTEKDYPTEAFMQWFVLEQVEEEATALKVVERLEMAGNDQAALLMLDREMGARTSTE
ncbi:MAG TPA: ferritin [Gemmatimonadota bacterium]|nr:ferritin [Gemmatimonadota bacterium]